MVNKKILLFIFGILIIYLISFVNSGVTETSKNFVQNNLTSEYGKYEVKDLTSKNIASLELMNNTIDCLVICNSLINITLYEDKNVIDEIRFLDKNFKDMEVSIKDINFYYQNGTKKILQDTYKLSCNNYTLNSSIYTKCNNIIDKKIEVEVPNFIEFNISKIFKGESKNGISYNIKIEGKKKQNQILDWQIKSVGTDWLNKWAIWGSGSNISSYFKFDEGNGSNAYNQVSPHYNLTLTDDGSHANWTNNGKINNATYFIAGSSLNTTNIGLINVSQFNPWSLSFWINDTYESSNGEVWMSNGNLNPLSEGLILYTENPAGGKNLVLQMIDSWSTQYIDVQATAPSLNLWHHVVITSDGTGKASGYKIYFDNVSQSLTIAKDTVNSEFVTNHDFMFGTYIGKTQDDFRGEFDEFAFYNRNLTELEVSDLYNNGNGLPFSPGITLVNIDNPTSFQNLSSGTNININFTLSNSSYTNCIYYFNNSINYSIANCQNFTLTLSDGMYNITVYANESSSYSQDSVNFTVDTINPGISLLNPSNNTNNLTNSFNFTANINDTNFLNATLNIYNQTGIYNQTFFYNQGIIGIVVDLIDGVYNWWYNSYDYSGNYANSGNYSLIVSNLTVYLNTPINSTNSSNFNQFFNATGISSVNSLKNSTLFIWNSSNYLIFNQTNDLTNLLNYSTFNYTLSNYDNYLLNINFCDNNSNCRSSNSNNSLNIYNSTITLNISSISSNLLEPKVLSVNTSGTNLIECNFTIEKDGVYVLGNASNFLNNVWNSSSFYPNKTGTYFSNVTCRNSFGDLNTANYSFIINYSFVYSPTNYTFNAQSNKTEFHIFNLSAFDDTSGNITYNITVGITNESFFTLNTTPSNIILNETDGFSNPIITTFSLNSSSSIVNGSYYGNITFSNSTYNLTYVSYFQYNIFPPSGNPFIYNQAGDTVCGTYFGNCYTTTIPPLIKGTSRSFSFNISNQGFYPMYNCSAYIDGLTGLNNLGTSGIVTFSDSNFTLDLTGSKLLTITVSPTILTPTVNYYGSLRIRCENADLGGNPQENPTNNRPLLLMQISSPTPAPPGAGGGGGGTLIPVLGLVDTTNSSYSNLTKELIYTKINNLCSIKLTGNPIAVDDYSDNCQLKLTELETINSNLSSLGFNVTFIDLQEFYHNYLEKLTFQGFESQDIVAQYGLFASIQGERTFWTLNPPNLNTIKIIFSRGGSHIISSTITSSKPIGECEVLKGENINCKYSNSTVIIDYTIKDTNFLSRIFSGNINLKTDRPEENLIENKNVVINYTVYNLLSNTAFIIYFSILSLIIGATLFYLRRKKKKLSLSSLNLKKSSFELD